jgi:oligosaccharide translocation protein RFT1
MVVTVYLAPQYAVEAGYFGQVGVSILYLCSFWGFFYYEFWRRKKNDEPALPIQSLSGFLPNFPAGEEALDWRLANLVWSFFVQGLAKQALTEAEKYLMTIKYLLTMAEQGVFDIVSNLGLIPVRILLLPIEDGAYSYFTKILQRVPLEQQDRKAVTEASNSLFLLFRVMTLLGLSAISFGVPFAKTILAAYGGESLTSGMAPFLMQLNCGLILLLALNGVTEGYTTATVSKAELDKNSFFMILTFGVYILFALCLVNSSPDLVIAKAVTLIFRIARSFYLINKQYEGTLYSPLKGLAPNKREIFALMLSFVVCSASGLFSPTWTHLFLGILCLCGVLLVICVNEPELLEIVWSKLSFLSLSVQSSLSH